MGKVASYIGIALVIVISVVALFSIPEAIKITVNAIVGVILVGTFIAILTAFSRLG